MAGNYREYRDRADMREHGWKIDTLNKECNRCGAEITWATSPNGKKLPLDVNSTALHFKSCSNGGAPNETPASPPQPPRATANQPDGVSALRDSLDECAQAVRELCRILRSRAEAAKQ